MGDSKKYYHFTLDSPEIRHLCAADQKLSMVIHEYGDLKYTLQDDHFSYFVGTIVGQMLSSKVADVLLDRLVALCDGNLSAAALSSLSHEEIKSIGLSGAKTEYIVGFTKIIVGDPHFFLKLKNLTDAEIVAKLTSIRGVGNWTAKMYLIFALNKLDVLPYEDGAFLQVYQRLYQTDDTRKSSIEQQCKAWRPYSSIAARYFYRALDSGML
jgi:DNA-3-methyladenine glycosylase II